MNYFELQNFTLILMSMVDLIQNSITLILVAKARF